MFYTTDDELKKIVNWCMQIYNTILHTLQCNGISSLALYEVLKCQMDKHNYKPNFRESIRHEQS